MRLSELFNQAHLNTKITQDIEIKGLSCDSRLVQKGFLFFAIQGTQEDGLEYVPQAIQNGAIAIITQQKNLQVPIPSYQVQNIRSCMALMSARFYQPHPKNLVAVTGTNGKTSSVVFVREIWEAVGLKAASIGTLGTQSANFYSYNGRTTSDSISINQQLQMLAKNGITHVAIEASSHGLDQNRLGGLYFQASAFTNLTQDHLDYHLTMENYLQAKMKLFSERTAPHGTIVLNADIPQFNRLYTIGKQQKFRILTYGKNGKELQLIEQKLHKTGQELSLEIFGEKKTIYLPVAGSFQGMNVLCALGLAIGSGINEKKALDALTHLEAPDGRMELIATTKKGASIFVDYAHTPDGLEKALTSLRPHAKNKLHVLFGCGGNRDKSKRPIMGEIASRLADVVIVTDDNPRMEDAALIRQQIMDKVYHGINIGNRAQAIHTAICNLGKEDVLLLAGKGHEEGQIIQNKEYPFKDRLHALWAIKKTENTPLWTSQEIAKALHTTFNKDLTAFGVSINTRTLQAGDIFIAVKGDSMDGHAFVSEALKKGAVLCITDHTFGEKDVDSERILTVPDTKKALYQLAEFAKQRSHATRIGITGSAGKTTSKEMLVNALTNQGHIHATYGNLNNEWGVPLTLANMPKDTDFAVIEMGMNHFGEMERLSRLVEPHIALITMIGSVHLEFFKNEAEIAQAKAEIFTHMPKGIVVLNKDSPFFDLLKTQAIQKGITSIHSFGQNDQADFYLKSYKLYEGGSTVRAFYKDQEINYSLLFSGLHFILDSLGVLSIIQILNIDIQKAINNLSKMSPVQGRGAIIHVKKNGTEYTVIDDAYNANPNSMHASIQVLETFKGRKIAVIGDMLELGQKSELLHTRLIEDLEKSNVDKVYAVGPMMKKMYDKLPLKKRGGWQEKAELLQSELLAFIKTGDTILVKASNGMHLEEVVKALTE